MQSKSNLIKIYKTAIFKIYKPTRHRRAMLADAMLRNHLAYSKVLDHLLPHLESLAEMKKLDREKHIHKTAASTLKSLPISIGAKAGIQNDVASQIEAHLELRSDKQPHAGKPTAARLSPPPADALTPIETLARTISLEEENAARDAVMREAKRGQKRPVLFLKNRKSDGFLILRHAHTGRYWAWLNLHGKDSSRFAESVQVTDMADIRTGEIMHFKSKTGALFPLAFGRDYQEAEFLTKGRPQSAKLVQRGEEFALHIAFAFESPAIEPLTVMGVDRGIYNLASMAVIDGDGRILAHHNEDGRGLRHIQKILQKQQKEIQSQGRRYRSSSRRAMADEASHKAANAIAEMAFTHRAQVVLEDLSNFSKNKPRTKGIRRSNFNPVINRKQYQKIQRLLEYKLACLGLPPIKTVAAARTSQTCPHCGHVDKDNRLKIPDGDGFKMDRFACLNCGYTADADLNAARVIALKRLWRESLPPNKRKSLAKNLDGQDGFDEFIRRCAARRGEGS